MKNCLSPVLNHPFVASLVAAALLAGITASHAAILPYTPDANTTFLFHLDGALGTSVCTNIGTVGGNSYTVLNTTSGAGSATPTVQTTMLGTASPFTGFGNVATFGTAGLMIGYDGNDDGIFEGDVSSSSLSPDVIAQSKLGIGVGSFTIEAMVQPENDTVNQEFVCMDSDASSRGFQFKITSTGAVQFQTIGGTGVNTTQPIPSFIAGTWYHVAAVYNSTNSTFQLYWTPITTGTTAATPLGAAVTGVTMTSQAAITGPLIIGNEDRNSSQETFSGAIDEVRISSVARSATGMLFFASGVTVSSPSPASALIPQNGSTSFTVTASPSRDFPNVTYQWYEGTPGSGAAVASPDAAGSTFTGITGPTLTISGAGAGDNGATYYCVVSQTGTANTATSTAATLTVHTPQPLEWTDTAANGLWDLVSGNWFNLSTHSTVDFYTGDNAIFNDSGPGGTVTLNSAITVSSVTFSNNSKSYTVSGSGGINGTGSLTNNSGVNTISTTNAFSGNIAINAGTLTIGGAGNLGGGNYAGSMANSGTFNFDSTASQTLSGVISQSGALAVSGAGVLTLAGTNTYSGGTTIGAESTLELGATGSFGTGNVTNNGVLWFSDTQQTVANDIAGTGILTNDATGTVTLTGDNIYSGATIINGPSDGGLVVGSSGALGNTPSVTLITSTGGPEGGTRITLSNGVVTPSSIPLYLPCTSTTTRSLLYSVSNNNTWGGPIILNGDEQAGDTIAFGSGTAPGVLTIQGTVTGSSFDSGTLQLRGNDAGTSTGQSLGGGNGVVNGVINLGGGTLQVNDGVRWTINSTGNTWGGTTVANGGTLQLGANNVIPVTSTVTIDTATIASSLDLNGFSQQLAGLVGTGGAGSVVTNSSLTSPGTLILSGIAGAEFTGSIVDGGATTQPANFTLTGGSELILGALNTYFGNTVISGGSDLFLTATGSITNSASIDVQSGSTFDVSSLSSTYTINLGQTLLGSGAVNGPLIINGTVSAGETAAIGTLTIASSLTLQGNANFRINKTGSVLTSDQITGYGALTYGGTLTVASTGSTPFAANDSFTLFNGSPASGNFTSIHLPPLPLNPGLVWNISQLAATGTITVATGSDQLLFTTTTSNGSVTAVNFSWAPNLLGWTLQSNSVNIGVQADWLPIAGSTSATNISIPVSQAQPFVFFRLAP
jgi:fibronectin-binding autotransporter adhesin